MEMTLDLIAWADGDGLRDDLKTCGIRRVSVSVGVGERTG